MLNHTSYDSKIMKDACPVCGSPAALNTCKELNPRIDEVDCLRCAKFEITYSAKNIFCQQGFSEEKIAYISSWLRNSFNPKITENDFKELQQITPPSIDKKVNYY